ncbi:MAG: hypothetical protein ACU0DT_01250, partial [Albimonas sp.]|uniref:hypothetical protein n=1 Tax=Albimonas sp. TaxID=1872425 RepID=UPI0040561B7E
WPWIDSFGAAASGEGRRGDALFNTPSKVAFAAGMIGSPPNRRVGVTLGSLLPGFDARPPFLQMRTRSKDKLVIKLDHI